MSNEALAIEEEAVRSYNPLKTKAGENFHIDRVQVILGDDDYNETDCLEISVDDVERGKLMVGQKVQMRNTKTFARLRNEPAVKVFLSNEDGPDQTILIYHHKGEVFIDVR